MRARQLGGGSNDGENDDNGDDDDDDGDDADGDDGDDIDDDDDNEGDGDDDDVVRALLPQPPTFIVTRLQGIQDMAFEQYRQTRRDCGM